MPETHRPVGSPVSSANAGKGLTGWSRVMEECGPSISLRLGIGPEDDVGSRVKAEEHFKHAQLAQRCNLFLPRRDLEKHRLTSVGFSHEAIRMSLELERCRRTDGKKWRCRKAAIPDKKYCELHINRGCGRSRKPVEVSEIVSLTATRDPIQVMSHSNEITVVKPCDDRNLGLSKADIGVSRHVRGGVFLESTLENESTSNKKPEAVWKVASPQHLKADVPVSLRLSAGISPEWYSEKKNNTFGLNDFETSVSVVTSSSGYKATINNAGKSEDRYGFDHRPDVPKIRIRINDGIKRDVLPGFGSSAKSLIPGCTDPSKTEESDQDQWRCRRTDGKKWRCYRDVHPNQKYCLQHMHRGSKKPQLSSPLLDSATSRCPTLVSSKTAKTSDAANIISTSLTISSPAEDK